MGEKKVSLLLAAFSVKLQQLELLTDTHQCPICYLWGRLRCIVMHMKFAPIVAIICLTNKSILQYKPFNFADIDWNSELLKVQKSTQIR